MCLSENGDPNVFRKCEESSGGAVEQEGNLCHEVEAVRYLTYPGVRVSSGETDATALTRCVLVRKCG